MGHPWSISPSPIRPQIFPRNAHEAVHQLEVTHGILDVACNDVHQQKEVDLTYENDDVQQSADLGRVVTHKISCDILHGVRLPLY